MSILDKVIAAVTPPESAEERAEARLKANNAAAGSEWLTQILEHHLAIEDAFAAVLGAEDAAACRAAEKRLGLLLTGHSIAEEAVIYPAMSRIDQAVHATEAYTEQSAAKVQMAALAELAPLTEDYLDKLEHLRGAVAHHVYREEGTWYPKLREEADADVQALLAQRYREEFARYMGTDADLT
jgi:hemerythrin superfamily protein